MKRTPKISCLMVTKANRHRFPLFQRSLRNYLEQTYSNRELVIVADPRFPSGLKKIEKIVHSLDRTDIKLVRPPRSVATLGALRNLSIQQASGSVLCQWDDDDIHAPDRLQKQLRALTTHKAQAVYLQKIWQYFESDKKLSVMDWQRCWPGCHTATGMYYKDVCPKYPASGPKSQKEEDLYFFLRLAARVRILQLRPKGFIYIYTFHGENTWNRRFLTKVMKMVVDPSKAIRLNPNLRRLLRKTLP